MAPTKSWWTTSYADLMDPDQPLVETRYNFTGIVRAWERSWLRVARPDKTLLLWNVKGNQIHDGDRIPDFVHVRLLSKYGDRLSIA